MAFFLPADQYDKASKAPTPAPGTEVEVTEMPQQDLAVLQFSGFASEFVIAEQTQNLKSLLRADGVAFKDDGTVILNQYNPPWTIPFLRLNEVAIPVQVSDH